MFTCVITRFEYTDVAPACAPKVREVSILLVPSDAGLVFPGVDGYPAPAQPFRTLLVVPGADFSELVRVEAVYDWSYAFMSRAPWGNPEEPTVSFQTEPVLSGGSWGISTSRAEYTCEPVE